MAQTLKGSSVVARRTKPERSGVQVTVRLFGAAQIVSGLKDVTLQVPSPATESTLARSLAEALPELVGPVVREDLEGLQTSYTINLNGLKFVRGDAVEIEHSDTLLLFSSQAGG